MNNQPVPQPILQPIEGTDTMQVAETYQIFLPNLNKMLTILPGFITDGASIPQCFWSCAGDPFSPDFVAAAVAHDGLYAAELSTRDQCDNAFLDLLGEDGLSWLHRNVFFYAVRWFGGFVWDKHTDASISEARKYCSLTDAPNADTPTTHKMVSGELT